MPVLQKYFHGTCKCFTFIIIIGLSMPPQTSSTNNSKATSEGNETEVAMDIVRRRDSILSSIGSEGRTPIVTSIRGFLEAKSLQNEDQLAHENSTSDANEVPRVELGSVMGAKRGISDDYIIVNAIINYLQWGLRKQNREIEEEVGTGKEVLHDGGRESENEDKATYRTLDEDNIFTEITTHINFTSCSEIDTALFLQMENYTVQQFTNESLTIAMYKLRAMFIFEFVFLENVTEYMYCTGIRKYMVTAYGSSGVDNQTLAFGFNASLPNGALTVYEDCWDIDRDPECISGVWVLEDFLHLPIISYTPDDDKFWDFSANVFDPSYHWLKSMTMDWVPVDWTMLTRLNNSDIEELTVTYNAIIYMFPDVPILPSLKCLDMTGSQFMNVPVDQLQSVPNLEKLILSDSMFTENPQFIFDINLPHLRVLELRNLHTNVDINVRGNLSNMVALEELDLSRNKFSTMSSPFPSLQNLTYLNFSYVLTGTFHNNLDLFGNLPSLKVVDLSGNKLHHLAVSTFKNQRLERLYLAHNRFQKVDPLLFFNQNMKVLDLSYNRFKRLPVLAGCDLDYLNASYNSLSSLVDLSENGTRVGCLDVSRNNISSWNVSDLFLDKSSRNTSQKFPSLSGEVVNRTWVDVVNISGNAVRVVSSTMRRSLDTLLSVDLVGNPFDCSDCSVPDLQKWLKEDSRNLVRSPETLVCRSPASKVDLRLRDFKFHEQKCLPKESHLLLELGIPCGVVVLISVTFISAIYWYRFELSYIRHLLKLRGKKVEDQYNTSLYDAFICYSGIDRAWVMRNLAPALENSPERYRLCLHDRDFPLGSRIVHNIVHSIEESRRTVVILTEEFINSKWCQWELEMANHRMFENSRNFLVLIELENLQRDKLPRHLRWLMDTRTYLEWPKDRSNKKAEEAAMKRLKKALGPSIFHASSEGERECA